MKKELKDQFLPTNTAWMARESLKKLNQTGSVRDCVKEFSSLIFDIKDMSEVDKLFNIMSGVQGWAQTELRRQGVQDLPSAMAAADCLSDYRVTSSSTPTQKGKGHNKESNRKSNAKTSKSGGKGWKKLQNKQAKVGGERDFFTNYQAIRMLYLRWATSSNGLLKERKAQCTHGWRRGR